jgi:hypothetical protein
MIDPAADAAGATHTPLGHEDALCDHCGKDYRLHSNHELVKHANDPVKPYRQNRDDIISKGLKLGSTVKDVAEQLGGKLQQRDMRRMMGRDIELDF